MGRCRNNENSLNDFVNRGLIFIDITSVADGEGIYDLGVEAICRATYVQAFQNKRVSAEWSVPSGR